MKTPLKIVHILAGHNWTGSAEGVVTLCRDLDKAGHQVRLFIQRDSRRALADRAGERGVIPSEDLRLNPNHPLLIAWDILNLRRILDRDRPDILHLHGSSDHWVGSLAARLAAAPVRVVRTIHHPKTIEARPFQRWLFGSATDGFITFSERDRQQLAAAYGIGEERVSVIHGAVDTLRFHPDHDPRPIRAEFGIKPAAPVIGMVARFQSRRGHAELIRALGQLRKKVPAVRLLLVGKGEYKPAMMDLVRQLELEHCVLFAGYRDRDLPQVYGAMDIKVMLESGSDTSCRAVLEAMACGLPVVAYPVGALPETIVEGVTGRLVPGGDTGMLVQRLVELLEDRILARRMGEAGRQRVEEDFSEEMRRERTERFYDAIPARGGRSAG